MIRFTSISKDSRASLTAAIDGSPVDVLEGASSTFSELTDALTTAWKSFQAAVPNSRLITVAIDETSNELVLGVAPETTSDARDHLEELQAKLGVPLRIEARPNPLLEACTARNTCYDPMKAGSYLRNQGTEVWQECTMGFHVYLSTGYGFAMAGHCSYAGNSDLWYMDGWPAPSGGYIGSVVTTLYKDLGQDFMVVRMNSTAQRSNQIYATTRRVQGRGNPISGETICASLGFTNSGIDCGTVRNANVSWVDDNGFIIRGADHDSIATNTGDSGSPLYRPSGTTYAVAIGIHNTHDGYFAKMADALTAAGVRIYP